MRLIDADDRKLRAELTYFTCVTGIDEAPYLFAVDELDKAPTVDAIPVEWIAEWITTHDEFSWSRLLHDWREERKEE